MKNHDILTRRVNASKNQVSSCQHAQMFFHTLQAPQRPKQTFRHEGTYTSLFIHIACFRPNSTHVTNEPWPRTGVNERPRGFQSHSCSAVADTYSERLNE